MKYFLTFFIATIFLPLFTTSQTKVSVTDLEELIGLSEQGQVDKANERINAIRQTVTTKDSLYLGVIMASAEMNKNAFNFEEAITDNEEIIQLNPQLEIGCLNFIANFKGFLGDFDGKLAVCKRILQLQPNDRFIFNNMASTYNSLGKYEEAIEVLNSNPNTERLSDEYFTYSVAFFNLNKLDSAKFNLEKYLSTEDISRDILVNKIAAQIYAALGDKEKSCEYITKAIDIITTERVEDQISEQTARVQEYFFIKYTLEQIAETKNLFLQLCP